MKKAEGIFLRQLIMRLLHVLNVLVADLLSCMDGRGLLPSKPGGVEDTVCWMCQSELQNLFGSGEQRDRICGSVAAVSFLCPHHNSQQNIRDLRRSTGSM